MKAGCYCLAVYIHGFCLLLNKRGFSCAWACAGRGLAFLRSCGLACVVYACALVRADSVRLRAPVCIPTPYARAGFPSGVLLPLTLVGDVLNLRNVLIIVCVYIPPHIL